MKKISYLLIVSLMSSFTLFTACGDKDDKNETTDWKDYKYSELTPEQQKSKLQDDANAILSELEGLSNGTGVQVLKTFYYWLNIDSPELGGSEKKSLRASETTIYLSNFVGKFTWNMVTESWDYTEAADRLEFEFPAKNAICNIVIPKITSSVIIEVPDENFSIEVPKDVTAKIYANQQQVGTVHIVSEIVDDKTAPKLTEMTYSLDNYSWSTKVTKGSPNTLTSSLKKGDKTLFEASIDLSGNLDNLLQDKDPGKMEGNFFFNLNNTLAFAGNYKISDYTQALAQADQADNSTFEAALAAYQAAGYTEEAYLIYRQAWDKAKETYVKASVTAFNTYTDLWLISISDKTKIAQLKEKAKLVQYEDWSWWEEVPVLVFGDKTEVEAEVYFSSGFNLFLENWNKFIEGWNK